VTSPTNHVCTDRQTNECCHGRLVLLLTLIVRRVTKWACAARRVAGVDVETPCCTAVSKNPMPHGVHANFVALNFIEPKLLPMQVLHCGDRDFRPFLPLRPWPWLDDHYIRTWPVFPGDIGLPFVQIWTLCVKALESYRLTGKQTDKQTRPKLYTMPLRGWSKWIFVHELFYLLFFASVMGFLPVFWRAFCTATGWSSSVVCSSFCLWRPCRCEAHLSSLICRPTFWLFKNDILVFVGSAFLIFKSSKLPPDQWHRWSLIGAKR